MDLDCADQRVTQLCISARTAVVARQKPSKMQDELRWSFDACLRARMDPAAFETLVNAQSEMSELANTALLDMPNRGENLPWP